MARLQNYLVGGVDNFSVDRELGNHLAGMAGNGGDGPQTSALAVTAFMVRATRYLITHHGVRQFLNVGATIPGHDNLHEVAQKAAPESRIVYVASDPVVLAHAHSLRKSTPEGAADFVHHDLRDPDGILDGAAATLDFARPVAVVVVETLTYIREEDDPHAIVARLLEGVPSGSFLVLSHTTGDISGEQMAEVAEHVRATTHLPFVLRSLDEIRRFFDGLSVVEPGFVQIDQWHPDDDAPPTTTEQTMPTFGAVACKP